MAGLLVLAAWAQGTASASSPAAGGARLAAADEPSEPSERTRLLARQQALQAAFDAEAAGCRSRFVVTPCLEDVAQRRRLALEPLRERLLQLDEAERRERAAARRQAVAARVAEREQQAAAAAAAASAAAAQAGSAPAVRQPMLPRAPVGERAPSAAAAASQAQAREQAAAQRAAQARRRAEEAAARQARVQQRLDERQAAGRPAQALPPDSVASQPAPKPKPVAP